MAGFCLLPEYVDRFKRGLKDGSVNPDDLANLSSEERHQYLSQFVGEDASLHVNALFESKLLLKNQKAGMISWAKKVGGLTPEVRRDMISKIEKLDRVLNPDEQGVFLKDLAEVKLGVGVSDSEAKAIYDLSEKVKAAKSLQQEDGTFANDNQRLAWGRSQVQLANYVNNLKEQASHQGVAGYVKNPLKLVSDISGNAKSINTTLDNSAIFHQGWKTLFTHPLTWQRNARKTFSDLVKTLGGQKVMDEINADIISRPNYDRMLKGKLAVGTVEEAFPGTIAEKIPLVGRAVTASENAYTGFVYRQRADIYDKYLEIAKRSGLNIDDAEVLKPIASMVNSLTGRGNFGKFEGSLVNAANNVFFSPRNIKSQFDTFLHPITGAGGSNFVRKEAAINLIKIITGTGAILAIADAVSPGSVEKDPRSADFGKIKVGDTRFDVTGGASSLLTLAARLWTNSSKSSTTGVVSELNTGEVGSKTSGDLVYNFFTNKLAPAASVVKDLLTGKDFKGNKPTLEGEAKSLITPLGIKNYQELQDNPNSADITTTMLLDGLGVASNTYGDQKTDPLKPLNKQDTAFKQAVGEAKFKEATSKIDDRYNSWLRELVNNNYYKTLSEQGKKTLLQQGKNSMKDQIYKDYGFKYQRPKDVVNPEKGTIDKLKQQSSLPSKEQDIVSSLLDLVSSKAYASDGNNQPDGGLFGTTSYKTDYKTGKTEETHIPGLIEKGVNALKEVFTGKKLVNPYISSSNGEVAKPSPTATPQAQQAQPVSTPPPEVKAQIDQGVKTTNNLDFSAFKQDQEYTRKFGRPNFNPPSPPKEILDVIKKYFPDQVTQATLVAATENAQFDPKRADNVNKDDGSRDRGIFQINSNSFSGLMARQQDLLNSKGIYTYDDMYDPDKNAFVAKLIREGSKQANPQTNGWGPWYGWQDTGYNINNGWFSQPKRISYELAKRGNSS